MILTVQLTLAGWVPQTFKPDFLVARLYGHVGGMWLKIYQLGSECVITFKFWFRSNYDHSCATAECWSHSLGFTTRKEWTQEQSLHNNYIVHMSCFFDIYIASCWNSGRPGRDMSWKIMCSKLVYNLSSPVIFSIYAPLIWNRHRICFWAWSPSNWVVRCSASCRRCKTKREYC